MSFELSGHMTYFQPPHSFKREGRGFTLPKMVTKAGNGKIAES